MNELFDWLLVHYGQEQFHPGLERIRFALKDLLPPLQNKTIVTVAGTNGKGETTLWLSRYLKNHPHCVWISPHIERITERFQSEIGEIPLPDLERLVHACHEQVLSKRYQLSFYEFLFFVFCRWALERDVPVVLLEVGLGGRLDAVNVLDADLVLLPSISRDHQEFLGPRLEQILGEKLAVLRPRKTLLTFLTSTYLKEKTYDILEGREVSVTHLDDSTRLAREEFSQRNQLLAYAAYCHLMKTPFREEHFLPEASTLEHRGEHIELHHQWRFFGSHNVDGLRKLIQFLHSQNYNFPESPFQAIIASFSKRDPRDIAVMMKMLKCAHLGDVIITTFNHPKAAPADLVMKLASKEGLDFAQDPLQIVQAWKPSRILVLGSYYFMGDLKSRLRSRFASTPDRR